MTDFTQDSFLSSKKKYAIGVTYIGARYCGWQNQPGDRPSVQSMIELCLSEICKTKMIVTASGRTDAGVNAVEQVIHFSTDSKSVSAEMLVPAMNSQLPEDVRVLWAKPVSEDFHAQRSAIRKQYSYYYLTGPCALPEWRHRTTWIRSSLDVQAMNHAIQALIGRKDFRVFQGRKAAPLKSTIRTIFEAEVTEMPSVGILGSDTGRPHHKIIRIRLVGNGFLKQMVRSIAGTLREVGEGRRPTTAIADLLSGGKRSEVGVTAAPHGLWLERVDYP